MGYDFQQGEESFHWSGDNWLRIIQMARRFGFDEEIGKQVETLSAETVNKLKEALWKALDAGALPLMDIRTGLDVWKGAMPDHVHTTSNAFFFSIGGHELVITEENTRWQGVFFLKLLEFTNGLQDAEMIVS